MAYPLESLLRPAYELRAAAVSALAAAGVMTKPSAFLLTRELALGLAGVLICHAAWRCFAGLRILRYRANLRRQRRYVVASEDIPWSAERLFLGRGFHWDQRHTQRLHEARLPEKQDLLKPGLIGRTTEFLRHLPPEHSAVGGDPAIHGVEPAESDIWMDISDRVGHTLVLGTTRVGKTRLAEVLLTQDIRRGEVVIVFDPKGDIDLLRRVYAEAQRAGRQNEFFMFHLGHPEVSARYNPVGSFSRITEVATRIAGQLPSEGQSAAFKEFVWRFVNVMARALVALGRKPDYEQINRYASNVEPLLIDYFEHWLDGEPGAAGWREEVESMAIDKKSLDKGLQSRGFRAVTLVEYARRKKLYDPIANALASTLNYEKSYFDKLVASLLPLMEKLTTGRTAALLSPDLDDASDWRPVFDWASVINLGGIVYIGLDSLSDYEVAAAVGNSMFADLTSVAGSIYKYGTGRGLPGETPPRRIAIHADEFNELIGDEFIPLLNKAGGAGFQVTAYTQTWSDVEARIGSQAKAGQIAGNFNTLIMLRVKEVATAELLTSQLPEVRVVSTIVSSSVSDTNDPGDFADFASRNEDRITTESAPMLAPSDLVQLPKGQAFALIHGGQLHKIRMPLPDASHDPLMPVSLEAIGSEGAGSNGRPVDPGAIKEKSLASRNSSFHEGVVAGALLAPLNIGFLLILGLLGIVVVAWIVNWTFVFKVWPEGVERLKGILAADLARGIKLAEWQGGVPSVVTGTANFLYGLVFGVTGIHDMGLRFAEGASLSIPDTIARNTYLANIHAIEVAMVGTQLLGVRLATLAMMVPLLVMIYLIAAVDGLTQRAIRRACGGRESASLYHRAKHLQVMLVAMGGMLILIQLVSIDPRLVGVPVALLVGLLARLQWACYKKHL